MEREKLLKGEEMYLQKDEFIIENVVYKTWEIMYILKDVCGK